MGFWRFLDVSDLGSPMNGEYDPLLVVLSITVACMAGYAALSVADRIRKARRRSSARIWFAAGGIAMGGGIWAMHFTAMTAFSMGMPVSYDVVLTLVSMAPGVLGGIAALHYMARSHLSASDLLLGGLWMAGGIGAMHYAGMEAMEMPAILVYDLGLFVTSIVFAYVLATTALYLGVSLAGSWLRPWVAKLLSAGVLGIAVAGMHYTAMAAASFYPDPNATVGQETLSAMTLGGTIFAVTMVVLAIAVVAAMVDRRLSAATARLQETEAWANAVLNTAADAILAISPAGTIVSFSNAAQRIFGFSSSEIVGQDIGTIAPALRPGAGESWDRETYAEVEGRRKDGAVFPAEVGVRELSRGDSTLYIVSARDISQRKELERQLAQAQKLESIGQLAAGIAHEINTPIQFVGDNARFLEDAFADIREVLDACSQVLAGGREGVVDPALVQKAQDAMKSADVEWLNDEIPSALTQAREGLARVSKIVIAMKKFSHPGSTEKKPVDLNEAIESTITVCRNEWKYVATMEMDLEPSLPLVSCLAGEMNQVILNVVVNAAHAIGSPDSSQEGELGVIRVATRRCGDSVEIRISDTGEGISEENRSRIFDPFFTTKEVGKGTGQGLALVHAVVCEKHEGTIDVESEVGSGTTFILRLPVSPGRVEVEGVADQPVG